MLRFLNALRTLNDELVPSLYYYKTVVSMKMLRAENTCAIQPSLLRAAYFLFSGVSLMKVGT